ncbi:MAG: cytidylate kinase-like family protein [Thermoguttaceae bacterium]
MKSQTREEPEILAAAERQMQTWVRTAQIEDRAIRTRHSRRLVDRVEPYIALSREEGAGGSEIAQAVGRQLGWEVLDRNLLDRVAERFHLSRPMLEIVDETRINWVHDVLGSWMDRQVIPTEKYVVRLACVVLAAARDASLVLVGRGTQFLLPREKGLTVRIVAPLKYRIDQVMRRENLSKVEAGQLIEERDCGRREFVERYFHHDIDDPHLYDLTINVQRMGIARAAEMIAEASQSKE